MKHRFTIFHGLMAWLVVSLRSGAAVPANPAGPDSDQSAPPISWNELGVKATAEYSGDGLSVNVTTDGARLRCVFQKLEAKVTPQGLWVSSSTSNSSETPFRVFATSLGRERGGRRTLSSTGTVETTGGVARFIRPGLIEEYSVSVDGLRQDFILPKRLAGEGALRVELKVVGASTEASPDSTRLVLEGDGRKLNYHRLRATDASGRELAARMEVVSTTQLAVTVEDGGAVYPVRIDPTFSDANWTSMGGIRGSDFYVSAAAVDAAGNLYIGGAFNIVGDVFASRIAKWNGSNWSALDSGMEGSALLSGAVLALAVSGTDLYAAGYFTKAGGIPVHSIARWNGKSWSALGSGMQGSGGNEIVYALAISDGNLYAAGSFVMAGGVGATNIAKWNGSSWSALGSGLNSTARALAVSGTNLYVGGQFSTAGGVAASNIAKWNGSSWSALSSGLNGPVYTLAISDSNLFAGGYFTSADSTTANSIAKWNGSRWSALGSGLVDAVYDPEDGQYYSDTGSVYALAVSGSELYAGGSFTLAGGTNVNDIAKWDGNGWSAVGAGGSIVAPGYDPDEREYVNTLVMSGTHLYAGGWFLSSDAGARYLAEWNGRNWSAFGAGMNGSVSKLALSGSDLYAVGSFTTVDRITAIKIAKWDGSRWSALASSNHLVRTVAVSGGDLFAVEADVGFNRVVKWNGNDWSALGGQFDGNVYALAVSGTNLYAGGAFSTAGGVAATNVAKWDGSSWSALGSGILGSYFYSTVVWTLATSGSDLYAGGQFEMAGGIEATNVAKWNGSRWSALGSGISPPYYEAPVFALAASGGALYVGGRFTGAGGIAANNIAKWNGTNWSALSSGISSTAANPTYRSVLALIVSGSDLYAGGRFTMAGGVAATNIAKWNGSSWSALGLGITAWYPSGAVNALAASGGELYVGGEFTTAGDKVSGNVARVHIGSAARSVATSGGSAVIHFSGVTGYEYDVQRATSLNGPITWTTVTINQLSPALDGSFTFTDTNAPSGTAYYRAVQH